MMSNLLPVTKNLLIINVLFYLATFNWTGGESLGVDGSIFDIGRLSLAAFYPTSGFFRPFQVATHMFMHGGLTHLLFNMYALFLFGSVIERTLGTQRYLIYYLVCGLGALVLHWLATYVTVQSGAVAMDLAYNTPILGASGAIYGLLAAFAVIAPNSVLQLIFPPIALKAKYFVLILVGIDIFLGISGFNTGIAHFAHIGGAAIGFLLLTLWRRGGGLLPRR